MTNILQNRWVQAGIAVAVLGFIAFAYTSDEEVTQETTAAAEQPTETPEVVQVNSDAETTPTQAEEAQEQAEENATNAVEADVATEND